MTHPASVNELSRSAALSAMLILSVVPLNVSAPLNLPLVVQVGPLVSVPVLLLPDESAAVVPLPSSKRHTPTAPEIFVGL